MRFLVTIALAVLIAAPAASAQSPATFPLRIKVADSSATVIPNATVSIARIPSTASPERQPIVLKTGHNGSVTAKLKMGSYVVTVSAVGFSTAYEEVSIPRKTSLVIGLKLAFYEPVMTVRRNPNQILNPENLPLHRFIPEIPHTFLPATSGSGHERPHHEGAKRERLDG